MAPQTANQAGPRARLCRAFAGATVLAGIALAGIAPAQAASRTQSIEPTRTTKNIVAFRLVDLEPSRIVGAQANFYASKRHGKGARRAARLNKELQRRIALTRVRAAARSRRALRVRRPSYAHRADLQLTLVDGDAGTGAGNCTPDPAALAAQGCPVDFEDTGSGGAASIWGSVDCESESRVQTLPGGDPEQTALGGAQGSADFRRMTAYDGDDFWGERCELGHNDNRSGPTAVYHEGDHKLTFASIRLPSSLPLSTNQWQVVLQIKQAQPAANATGTPVLALRAYNGRWALMQSNSAGTSWDSHEIWSAPATSEQWTRFAFDVHFSRDPGNGSIAVYADLNGDGDALDADEQSSRIDTYTLKYETAGGGSDGIDPGESIPSHLRAGLYHSSDIACPSGCSVDVDNVQVVNVG